MWTLLLRLLATEDGTAISRAHPSRAKGLMGQGKPVPSVILRFWVLVRPRELNMQPPALVAVNRSTDWANPAAVIIISGWVVFSNCPPLLFSSTKRSTLFSSGGCSTCYDHHKLLKETPYQWKKKDRIAESSSLFRLCSTCKIPCKRACLLLSQFWRIRERPCMNWIRSLLKMCYLLLEYPNPGLTAMRFDTHTFGKQSFMRANKIAYSTNPRVRAWFLRTW